MGIWGIAALALIGATATEEGRKILRNTAKKFVRAGLYLKENSSTVAGEVKEKFTDLVAEVEHERNNSETNGNPKKIKKESTASKVSTSK